MSEIEVEETSLTSKELYQKNQNAIKQLETPYQDFFFDCQAYLYLSTPPTVAVDNELSKLIKRLQIAERQGLSVEAVIGMDGESYCKSILRRIKAPKYRIDVSVCVKYVALYILLTLFIVSIFESIRGGVYYGDISAAIQMPVTVSLLGVPLQILTLFSAGFFAIQFRMNRSFDATWYSHGNILYLLATIVSLVAAVTIPFITHYYQVFLISFPVWLIWIIAMITGSYLALSDKVHFSDRIFTMVDNHQQAQEQKKTVEVDNEENNQDLEEENTSIWQTIRLKNPLLTRKSYRKWQEQQEKEEKAAEDIHSKRLKYRDDTSQNKDTSVSSKEEETND